MSTINEMFTTTETSTAATSNARNLAGTAQLTNVANELVAQCIKGINEDLESYKVDFDASQKDHGAMDTLIGRLANLDAVNIDFLKELTEETLEGMMKSQQSKRSRAKSKVMTIDNYKSMMAGAIAEGLVRMALGKEKSAGGSGRQTTLVVFDDAKLEALKDDQDQLKKELRNVQSKKSILKAKADFTTDDERWQALLVAESQLKAIRDNTTTTLVEVEVDTTKNKLAEVLGDVDIQTLKSADSKELLNKIKQLLEAE